MRLLLHANVYGWRMTGLMGAGGAWFLGFSKRPAEMARPAAQQDPLASRETPAACLSVLPPDNVVRGPWRPRVIQRPAIRCGSSSQRIIRVGNFVRLGEPRA